MNSGVVRLDQIMSLLLTMSKHRLQSLLLCFVLHMPNIILLNLNYIITDQRKLFDVERGKKTEDVENVFLKSLLIDFG